MNKVLEKSIPLSVMDHSVTNDAQETLSDWTADMEPHEEEATDKILEYLIQSGARPTVNVTGNIVDIVTSITNVMAQHIPDHLSHQRKVMTDYIARWLCDYISKTNIGVMRVSFGFDARINQEGGA
jgi:hypothetical protein